jgi:hypothetical protein
MDDYHRVSMFTRLLIDRMNRKCGEIKQIYADSERNWGEVMYVMLLRTMGDAKNKEAFTELARKTGYINVTRERSSLQNVEAMLLGTSGLLELYGDDTYIRTLKADFEYLRNKYSITPLMPGRWAMSNTNPNNHPVIRLVQLAAFLCTQEFMFDNMIKCRTVEDVHTLFRAEASEYWTTHYIPSRISQELPKRIGHFKANLLGINLVVPMMFAYAHHIGDDSLKERALELLEKISCEDNRIINGWRRGGLYMESAFDSQAVLQLNNEYCTKGLCWQCTIGKRVVRDAHESGIA